MRFPCAITLHGGSVPEYEVEYGEYLAVATRTRHVPVANRRDGDEAVDEGIVEVPQAWPQYRTHEHKGKHIHMLVHSLVLY